MKHLLTSTAFVCAASAAMADGPQEPPFMERDPVPPVTYVTPHTGFYGAVELTYLSYDREYEEFIGYERECKPDPNKKWGPKCAAAIPDWLALTGLPVVQGHPRNGDDLTETFRYTTNYGSNDRGIWTPDGLTYISVTDDRESFSYGNATNSLIGSVYETVVEEITEGGGRIVGGYRFECGALLCGVEGGVGTLSTLEGQVGIPVGAALIYGFAGGATYDFDEVSGEGFSGGVGLDYLIFDNVFTGLNARQVVDGPANIGLRVGLYF